MAPTLLCMCGRLLELDWIVALLDLRIDALFHKDAVPNHKGQYGPQTAGVVGDAVAVLLEHLENFLLIEDVLGLGFVDGVLGPAVELVAGQPVAHRHGEAQLLAVQNVGRNDLLHCLAQCVLGGAVGNLQVIRDGLGLSLIHI